MIRASFTAVPKRLPVLWGKVAIFAVVTFALMVGPVLIAFFASQAILSGHHILQISFSHPGVARAVFGGAALPDADRRLRARHRCDRAQHGRRDRGVRGLFFVIPPLLNILPTSWNNAISPWLPGQRGPLDLPLTHGAHSLSPAGGLALFCGYIAVRAGDRRGAARPPRHLTNRATRATVGAAMIWNWLSRRPLLVDVGAGRAAPVRDDRRCGPPRRQRRRRDAGNRRDAAAAGSAAAAGARARRRDGGRAGDDRRRLLGAPVPARARPLHARDDLRAPPGRRCRRCSGACRHGDPGRGRPAPARRLAVAARLPGGALAARRQHRLAPRVRPRDRGEGRPARARSARPTRGAPRPRSRRGSRASCTTSSRMR